MEHTIRTQYRHLVDKISRSCLKTTSFRILKYDYFAWSNVKHTRRVNVCVCIEKQFSTGFLDSSCRNIDLDTFKSKTSKWFIVGVYYSVLLDAYEMNTFRKSLNIKTFFDIKRSNLDTSSTVTIACRLICVSIASWVYLRYILAYQYLSLIKFT